MGGVDIDRTRRKTAWTLVLNLGGWPTIEALNYSVFTMSFDFWVRTNLQSSCSSNPGLYSMTFRECVLSAYRITLNARNV